MKKLLIIVVVIAILLIGTTAFAAEGQGRGNTSSDEDRLFRNQQEDCDGTCEDCAEGEEHLYGQDRDTQERGFGMNENKEECDGTCEDCEDGEERLYRQREDNESGRSIGRNNRR